jgi:superfamily II DNA or RNA helicase
MFLAEAFTLDTPGAEYARFGDGKTRFFKRGDVFLSGLTWRVIQTLVNGGYPKPTVRWPLVMERPPLSTRAVSLRPYQVPAVERAIRARRMGIHLPTGGGKTPLGIEIARRLGQRTLWLTYRKQVFEETVASFREFIGIEPGLLGCGKESDGQVIVAMSGTLARMLNKKTGAPETTKKWLAEFGCVIADEGHHASSPSWQEILTACTGANYRFTMSGTLDTGNDVNNLLIEGQSGPTVVIAETMELANQGWLARPRIVLLRVPADNYPAYEDVREFICPTWRDNPRQLKALGSMLFKETYERGIMDNPARNAKAIEVMTRHARAGERVLGLCSRVPHAQVLANDLSDVIEQPVWALDGDADDATRTRIIREYKETRGGGVLVATPFMREGVNIPEIDVGLLIGGGLSDVTVTQSLGRMLRKRPDKDEVLIYDFIDGGAESERSDKDYLANHSRSRYELYKSQGFIIERGN